MSKRDKFHDIVKQALEREGWTITHDPYVFKTDPKLAADLGAERLMAAERGYERIVVEIKSFLNSSQVFDLEAAIGQYAVYQVFLQRKDPERKLYLAVPHHALDNILSREVGQTVIEALKINLVVYSLAEEQPLLWKPQ
ncbi:MAG: element excision factor XisH family protein [Thiofilum sp.]|uniref:element excision factor XisH family protein n=1 Tax=Thiofilum sp. TaxID=2212733 RepID=UPI0025F1FADB|nr:element excision factor XisH family protein [Thiofilum sp.]MBK8454351.1 XisH family protein [Thiofilum sp.]